MINHQTIHKLGHVLLLVFAIAQIIAFIIYFNHGKILSLKIMGAVLWAISAILSFYTIYIFKKIGGVKKGASFVKTTKLVTTGSYSIVRHPQFFAGILLSLGFILISQHWLVMALGIVVMLIFYLAGVEGDQGAIKKFGKQYKDYMKKVPRFNIILGIARKIK